MIKRLYIDNYKCFVNFEYRPAPLQLLFGANGCGKSTLFEVLARLRDFVAGEKGAVESFAGTLTAWQAREQQQFELDIDGRGRAYRYKLVVVQSARSGASSIRVGSEELHCDGQRLYWFDGHDAHLCGDNSSSSAAFPLSASQSGIALIGDPTAEALIRGFRDLLDCVYVIVLDPFRMESVAAAEESRPRPDLTNFAAWYRHLAQDSPDVMSPMFSALAEAMNGFVKLKLTSFGTARILDVIFRYRDDIASETHEFQLHFGSLSHGQRCLIALFAILYCAVRSGVTICIDEPDNFIALREMQPWLAELCDRVEETQSQCLLVSHHPEFIDLLAVKHGVLFTRAGEGPVRIKPLEWSEADAIRPSELIARGWEE